MLPAEQKMFVLLASRAVAHVKLPLFPVELTECLLKLGFSMLTWRDSFQKQFSTLWKNLQHIILATRVRKCRLNFFFGPVGSAKTAFLQQG